MAPSDSQHPEIGVREERTRRRRRKRWTKQNKTNREATLHQLGLGWDRPSGTERWCKEEQRRKRQETKKGKQRK